MGKKLGTYVTRVDTFNTGGNCMIDFVHLSDGRVITVNDDCLQVFRRPADFWADDSQDRAELAHLFSDDNSEDDRQFVAFWGEGYGEPETNIVGRKFFDSESGYYARSVDKIDALQIGESVDLSDISGRHVVTRVN